MEDYAPFDKEGLADIIIRLRNLQSGTVAMFTALAAVVAMAKLCGIDKQGVNKGIDMLWDKLSCEQHEPEEPLTEHKVTIMQDIDVTNTRGSKSTKMEK